MLRKPFKYVPFEDFPLALHPEAYVCTLPQFSARRARVACPSLPEDLRRDLSFSFPFSFRLKNVVFGGSLVQRILAALSLYRYRRPSAGRGAPYRRVRA